MKISSIFLISLAFVDFTSAGSVSYSEMETTTAPISTTTTMLITTAAPPCPLCQDVYEGSANFIDCKNGDVRRDPKTPDPCDPKGLSVHYGFVIRNKGDAEVWGCCAGGVKLTDDFDPKKPQGWGDTSYHL